MITYLTDIDIDIDLFMFIWSTVGTVKGHEIQNESKIYVYTINYKLKTNNMEY